MNKPCYCFVILLLLLLGSQTCHAAKLKAYVTRFSVSTPENREELKLGLQTLLMSRLNNDEIQAVENQSEAEIQIVGSYIVFGTVFSLDALIKTNAGVFIDRVFVQGETQNELIPSVVDMANRLQRALMKWNPALTERAATAAATPVAGKSLPAVAKKAPLTESKPAATPKAKALAKPAAIPKPKPSTAEKPPEKPWVSQRLAETFNGIASGRSRGAEGTEVFITGEHNLGYYLKGEKLQFLSEVVFEADEIIISVDVADLDHDGVPEVYVTCLKGGLPAAKVYVPENNVLRKIEGNLPYLLRGITLEGSMQKIFAQKINAGGNFTGDIYELAKNGDQFLVRNPMQLPLFGTLYNFNRFSSAKGGRFFIVAHPDGYLLVYSKDKKQLWKSREKFGGRETLECPLESNDPNAPLRAATACSFSPPQRLLVTKAGEVIVSRNTGSSTSGAIRNYSKNNVVQLSWDGVALQEKWRSEQSQNYLADFSYDDRSNELLLLEVEPKTDSIGERGSRLVVQKLK